MENIKIEISQEKLSLDACYEFISNEECGGNCIFIGSVRNRSQGKEVESLNFETYKDMAIRELTKIAETAHSRFSCHKIYVSHREGKLEISDIAVIIGVSSVHRNESFKACRFVIDTLKKTVPIWKKEIFTDGFSWVNAHP